MPLAERVRGPGTVSVMSSRIGFFFSGWNPAKIEKSKIEYRLFGDRVVHSPSPLKKASDHQHHRHGIIQIQFTVPPALAGKNANLIPNADEDFFLLFQFYGPNEALLARTWKLPDVEEVHRLLFTSAVPSPSFQGLPPAVCGRCRR
jgi:hypothetical protein